MSDGRGAGGRVALVTLGCGRNEVDSDQVAGSLAAAGYTLVDDPEQADCVLVNTCTFIAPARQESIDVVLDACGAADGRVLVIGCMAQRYGAELAAALPEAAGVVGFADYPRLPELVGRVLAGEPLEPLDDGDAAAAPPRGRRSLPLLTPAPQPAGPSAAAPSAPPTAAFPVRTVPRGAWAYLKLAGGCDRACTFCTIPSYRGLFASRPLDEIVAEARWLVDHGVRELVCVSENTTSWGKDLPGGRRRNQVELVRALDAIEGLERVRLLYLQPAELVDELLDAMAASRVVAPYYDLSLQHASAPVLVRMGRSGSAERFAELVADIRARDPEAVFRSSFIVGFPGETDGDVDVLEAFLTEARLDWAGFFTFSPEEGTPAATMPDQVDPAEARARRDRLVAVAEAVAEDNAAAYVGRRLRVLVDGHDDGDAVGRSHREAPETDGEVRLPGCDVPVGRLLEVDVVDAVGVDLLARPAGDRLVTGARP
ncbi:MAG TPA: 30S ribosomal protein S12 methylthiotransferase RimO [Egibacteraceae bacterium]